MQILPLCITPRTTKALSKHSIIGANETHIQTACYCEGFSAATAITQQCTALNKRVSVYECILLWRNIGLSKKTSAGNVFMDKKDKREPGMVTVLRFDLGNQIITI